MSVTAAQDAVAKPGLANIHEGSTGIGVKCVQVGLNMSMNLHLAVDGIDGPKTTAAVRAFQHMMQLPVDGIVGPLTGGQINGWDFAPVDGHNCYYWVPTNYGHQG